MRKNSNFQHDGDDSSSCHSFGPNYIAHICTPMGCCLGKRRHRDDAAAPASSTLLSLPAALAAWHQSKKDSSANINSQQNHIEDCVERLRNHLGHQQRPPQQTLVQAQTSVATTEASTSSDRSARPRLSYQNLIMMTSSSKYMRRRSSTGNLARPSIVAIAEAFQVPAPVQSENCCPFSSALIQTLWTTFDMAIKQHKDEVVLSIHDRIIMMEGEQGVWWQSRKTIREHFGPMRIGQMILLAIEKSLDYIDIPSRFQSYISWLKNDHILSHGVSPRMMTVALRSSQPIIIRFVMENGCFANAAAREHAHQCWHHYFSYVTALLMSNV